MVFRSSQILLWVDVDSEAHSACPSRWDGLDRILLTRSYSEAVSLLSECRIDATLVVVGCDARRARAYVQWLRRHHERVPILVASRDHSPRVERELRRWPVLAYLPLPLTPHLLAAVLDQLRWPAAARRHALPEATGPT